MHSFNGCDCLTDSYFDPPAVGEIDHLYRDQISRCGKPCECKPKSHSALLSHHFEAKGHRSDERGSGENGAPLFAAGRDEGERGLSLQARKNSLCGVCLLWCFL
ncbi:hypothetical protein RJT34_16886 [Clitoria ternatea]|uniref:Uncharacterized protein n=1 Tax=Clitoria ternatea TaxID=43366 RepID=A0AAN9PCQ8_CLITE